MHGSSSSPPFTISVSVIKETKDKSQIETVDQQRRTTGGTYYLQSLLISEQLFFIQFTMESLRLNYRDTLKKKFGIIDIHHGKVGVIVGNQCDTIRESSKQFFFFHILSNVKRRKDIFYMRSSNFRTWS